VGNSGDRSVKYLNEFFKSTIGPNSYNYIWQSPFTIIYHQVQRLKGRYKKDSKAATMKTSHFVGWPNYDTSHKLAVDFINTLKMSNILKKNKL